MKKTLIWLSAAVLLPVVVGCGRAEYEARLDARLEQIKKGSAFGAMQVAVSLTNPELRSGTAAARLPKHLTVLPVGAEDGVDQRRTTPPNYTPRGHAATAEGFVTDSEGGKISYYCYLGATTLREQDRERTERIFRNRFTGAFPDTTVTYDQADGLTPTGSAVVWNRARVELPQEFYYVDAEGNESYRMAPAFYELWYRIEGDVMLSVAWRVPTDFAAHAEFDKWAPRVAGTVSYGSEDDGE